MDFSKGINLSLLYDITTTTTNLSVKLMLMAFPKQKRNAILRNLRNVSYRKDKQSSKPTVL